MGAQLVALRSRAFEAHYPTAGWMNSVINNLTLAQDCVGFVLGSYWAPNTIHECEHTVSSGCLPANVSAIVAPGRRARNVFPSGDHPLACLRPDVTFHRDQMEIRLTIQRHVGCVTQCLGLREDFWI